MHTFLLWLQWPGLVLGIAGAPLVASKLTSWRFWGFIVWLLSDLCWFGYGAEAHVWGLFWNYSFFIGTATIGAYNNRRNS